jgi:hypothetical protein
MAQGLNSILHVTRYRWTVKHIDAAPEISRNSKYIWHLGDVFHMEIMI